MNEIPKINLNYPDLVFIIKNTRSSILNTSIKSNIVLGILLIILVKIKNFLGYNFFNIETNFKMALKNLTFLNNSARNASTLYIC